MRATKRTYQSYDLAERVQGKLRTIRGADYDYAMEGLMVGRAGAPTIFTLALESDIELAERLARTETRLLDMRGVVERMKDVLDDAGEAGIRG